MYFFDDYKAPTTLITRAFLGYRMYSKQNQKKNKKNEEEISMDND